MILNPKKIQRKKRESGDYIQHGLVMRHEQQWENAINSFQEALKVYPEDQAAKYHLNLCHELKENPPDDENWDGAVTFLSK